MAFYDNLGDFFDTAGSAASLAGAGFDLYSGIKSYNQSQRMYDLAYGSAKEQDKYAKEQLARQKKLYYPIEDIQAARALQDIKATEGLHGAQRDLAIQLGMSDVEQAKALDPMFRQARTDVITELTQGPEERAARYRAESTADIQQAFGQAEEQRQRGLAAAGVNPASGAYAGQSQDAALRQALALAGGRTTATRAAEVDTLNRQQAALNAQMGSGFRAQPVPSNNAAAIAQNLASAGQTGLSAANAAALNAQAGMSGATYGFNQAMQSFGNLRSNPRTTVTPNTTRDQALRRGLGTGR